MGQNHTPALSPPSARPFLALATVVAALALVIGGLHVRAVEPRTGNKPATPQPRIVSGVVSDSEGQTIPDADLVCVIGGTSPRRDILKTDRDGEFSWVIPDGPVEIHVYAYKPGFAPSASQEWMPAEERGKRLQIKLRKPEPVAGTLVDRENQPVAAAKVRIELVATRPVETKGVRGGRVAVSFEHVPPDDVSVTPLESVYSCYTDTRGRFTFEVALRGAV
ncbi:MAG TPA: carboxypeptidase-like regulatory domain-containing protein [Isosphaeraceae bacterium]|nr:carboxypeptidase-like regulatory domain-containing protein [Isosphaeraceae bacterium]